MAIQLKNGFVSPDDLGGGKVPFSTHLFKKIGKTPFSEQDNLCSGYETKADVVVLSCEASSE